MDLGSTAKAAGKRSQPPLMRGEDAKKPKRVGASSSSASPFDLANVLAGASDAAKLRQQDATQRTNKMLESMLGLFKTADEIQQFEGVPVELEARIGYLGEKSMFTSGVSERVFHLMQRLLQQEQTLLIQPDVVETDYIYERPEEGNYRVTTVGDGEAIRVINAGTKTKRNDLLLNGLQNDTHMVSRLSVSTELEDDEKPEVVSLNWSMSRRKYRSTFTNAGVAHVPPTPDSPATSVVVPWRFDLTRVETTRAMRLEAVAFDPPFTTFEIELEMPPLHEQPEISLRNKVISLNDGVSLMMCALGYANRNSEGPIRWTAPSHLAHPSPRQPTSHTLPGSHGPQQGQMSHSNILPPLPLHKDHLRAPIDPNRNPDFPNLPLERVSNNHSLRIAFDRCFREHPQFDSSTRFVGTMPINFARRHLRSVQQHPYWVSEKTDGVRFMFFISRAESLSSSASMKVDASGQPLPSAYLIDRSNNFFRVPALQSFAASMSPQHDSLMDGELVKRHDYEGYYFLIFDIIALDGQRKWNLPFAERLTSIASVVTQFQHYSVSIPNQNLPFAVLAKEIVPTTHFNDVRVRIQEDSLGETIYRSSALCHLTDGLIFMPDGIYPLFTCQSMFKWKFTDRQTIDFEIVLPSPSGLKSPSHSGSLRTSNGFNSLGPTNPHNTTVELHIGGNGGSTVLIKSASLPAHDFETLRQDIATSMRPNLVIAEMGFEPKTGLWRYHKLRPDKDRPNYISIAMDTMESIAENITLSEVQSELSQQAH